MEKTELTRFLELSYDELEERNLDMLKKWETKSEKELEKEYVAFLKKERAFLNLHEPKLASYLSLIKLSK